MQLSNISIFLNSLVTEKTPKDATKRRIRISKRCMRVSAKTAEHLSKMVDVSREKGTCLPGDIMSSRLLCLYISAETRKTWKDAPAVFLM